jgi:membrane associated rhomboid family serine protease
MIPLRDAVPRRETPYVLWGLIALNGLVFLFELSLSGHSLQRFIASFGFTPARFTLPEGVLASSIGPYRYWSALTYMFIHGGWLHILGNMWFLWVFGDNVEDTIGHLSFLFFYILCGVAAVAFFFLLYPHSKVPTIGASGAISGIMGAYLLMFPKARVMTLIPIFIFPLIIEIPAIVFIGVWFFLQLIFGTFNSLSPHASQSVAWWAHVGGFVAGMLFLPLFRKRRPTYRPYFPDEPAPH